MKEICRQARCLQKNNTRNKINLRAVNFSASKINGELIATDDYRKHLNNDLGFS